MSFLTGTFWTDLLVLIVTLVVVTIAFFKWKFTYWEKRGLPVVEKPVILFGNGQKLFAGQVSFADHWCEIYNTIKSKGWKHAGYYAGFNKIYIPADPEIVRSILQKDCQIFLNHGAYIAEDADPLSGSLFNLQDDKWKFMRNKLSPAFTPGKVKMMFQTLVDTSVKLEEIIDDYATKNEPLDINDVLNRFTMDIISYFAFGLDCNSLRNPDSEFLKYGKKIFNTDTWDIARVLITFIFPHKFLQFIKFKLTNQTVEDFVMKSCKDAVDYREKNKIHREDIVDMLLQLKNRGIIMDDDKTKGDELESKSYEPKLTIEELCAQVYLIFAAGYETSASVMTFAVLELARNPDIQTKLRNEINQVLGKHNNQMTYEAIQEMKYLDCIINETLRLYPPAPALPRRCNQDHQIPGTSVVLEKGTLLIIPTIAIQRDPEHFPNPEKFDPDRFSDERKSEITPFTYFPFGEGPRLCIGLRLGIVESKVGLATLFKNSVLTLNKKTQSPVVFAIKKVLLEAEGGIWIDVKKIDQAR